MPTRNVVLTDYQADSVEQLVSSGRYQSDSKVLREGLRMIETRETEDKARLKALRDAARPSVADIEASRYRDFDSPVALNQFLNSMTKAGGSKPSVKPHSM